MGRKGEGGCSLRESPCRPGGPGLRVTGSTSQHGTEFLTRGSVMVARNLVLPAVGWGIWTAIGRPRLFLVGISPLWLL